MKTAILQIKSGLGNTEANLEAAGQLAKLAVAAGVSVLLLPELWNTGFYPRPIENYAGKNAAEAEAFMKGLALKYGINIVGGSIPAEHSGKIYNYSLVYNRRGEQVAAYAKTHLFSPGGENQVFAAGNELALFTLDDVRCGLIICYDLRFPEISRMLAVAGAKIMFAPAAWPLKRLNHWRILCQARAIENEIFWWLPTPWGTP